MNITKAIKKAVNQLFPGNKMLHVPTSYTLSLILDNASRNCSHLVDTIASCVIPKIAPEVREIRIYKGARQLLVFSIPVASTIMQAATCAASQLELHFNPNATTDQPELFDKPSSVEFDRPDPTEHHNDGYYTMVTRLVHPKKMHISQKAYDKIYALLDYMASKGYEVAWLGYISEHDDKFILDDVDVPYQTVRPASYTIPASSRFKVKDAEMVNCMVHSHVNMSVFFSGTDESDFRMESQATSNGRIYASLVTNARREYFGKIFDSKDGKYYELDFVKPEKTVSEYTQRMSERISY